MLAALEQMKGRHRRQRVAQEPPIDRNKLMTLSQPAKRFEIGQMRHAAHSSMPKKSRTSASRFADISSSIRRPMKMHVLPLPVDLLPDARFFDAANVGNTVFIERLRQPHIAENGRIVA